MSSLVLQIKQLINLLKNKISIGVEWVRGHTGVVGKELADMVAKMEPRQLLIVVHRGFP